MSGVSGLLKHVRLANKAAALGSGVSFLLVLIAFGGAFGPARSAPVLLAVLALATGITLVALLSQVQRLFLLQQAVRSDQKTLFDQASHDDSPAA